MPLFYQGRHFQRAEPVPKSIPPQPGPPSGPRAVTAGYSHIGARKSQQDAFYVSPATCLIPGEGARVLGVLCDGMGGLKDGALASALAVEKMKEAFRQFRGSWAEIPAFLEQELSILDDAIVKIHPGVPKTEAAGTTIAAVILEENRLFWASAGDSRIYLVRGAQMEQVTRDHCYFLTLCERVESAQITMEQAQKDFRRNALISYLGIGGLPITDGNPSPFPLFSGDIVLLCSDGLTKTLSDAEILETLRRYESLEEAARALPEMAVQKGGATQDNTSVILIRYSE